MSKILIHKTPQEYLDLNRSFLMENELAGNLTLGIPLGLDNKNTENPEYRFVSVIDSNNNPVAASVNISPRMMISANQNSEETVRLIAEYFNNSDFPVTSIIGEKGIPEIFVKYFKGKKKWGRDLIVHTLTKTTDLKLSTGKLESASLDNLTTLSKFRYDFDVDTFGHSRSDKEEIIKETERDIKIKNLYVWKSGDGIVSMAKIMRTTDNTAIIGRVFTPEEFRGNGFGTSIVHSLSNEILKSGLPVCALFTDKMNLTSSKIYYNVGYRPAMEFTDVYF
mgnify:CR=1 FL=1